MPGVLFQAFGRVTLRVERCQDEMHLGARLRVEFLFDPLHIRNHARTDILAAGKEHGDHHELAMKGIECGGLAVLVCPCVGELIDGR
ncbi:MAG: hypothetical protein O3B24_03585 [Verrucomicrobia bacterium]|nr:hypothetical protein [Verrucomicrobiota bacterium]